MQAQTSVVGGGMAGLSCAMRLLKAGQNFLLVTDNLGGRIRYSDEARINLGAYFVMRGYTHARQLVSQGDWINPADACFHASDTERFALLSVRTVRRLPELIRFVLAVREFAAHYARHKHRCLTLSQKAALNADAYLADLFTKPASHFIREKKFENAAADFIAKFTYACTGVGPDQLTALDFMNVSMGMLTPIHRFVFDRTAIAQRLGQHLITDTIIAVEKQGDHYSLTGQTGATYQAKNVVMATPAAITQKLLGLANIRAASQLYVHHVRAELKPIYRRYSLNLFPPTSDLMLTSKEFDGSYLIYAREPDADLQQVCDQYEILDRVVWDKAMYVQGEAFMDQQYGDGLYVAGDHNGLGLEPAAISGIFAANRIIEHALRATA